MFLTPSERLYIPQEDTMTIHISKDETTITSENYTINTSNGEFSIKINKGE